MPQNRDDFLREMVEKYARMYMKLAYRKGIPYDDVEDIVMEAYMAFRRCNRYETLRGDEVSAKLILSRIVVNKCTDYHRKHGRLEEVALEDYESEAEGSSGSSGRSLAADPATTAISRENLRRIQECIYRMKETWSGPAWLYFVEERSTKEISGALGISEAVCRTRISRARKHLQRELADIFQD